MRTEDRRILVLVLTLLYLEQIAGEKYGDFCVRIPAGQTKPTKPNEELYCLRNRGYDYCKKYSCPNLEMTCPDPLGPPSGICKYCNGTCSYGGSIYKVGESFGCLDGSNRCRCSENNRVASTKIMSSHKIMCFKKKAGGGNRKT